MNVALVISHLDPRLGGAEQWTWQFAQRLLARHHTVHVVASGVCPEAEPLGLVPHLVSGARSRLEFAAEAAAVVDRLPVDVIHDMGNGWRCDLFMPHGGVRAASFEQNLLLEPAWKRPWKRRLAAWLPRYREFDQLQARQYTADGKLVIALSKMVAEHLERFTSFPRSHVRIVYNGVDVERFTPELQASHRQPLRQQLQLADDETLLLIVAHNFELKGVATVIRATGLLAEEGIPLRLAVAGGKRFGRYQQLAGKCGVADRVTFLGPVDDAAPYYAAADIYVQPTFYDPCSLVVLEALASGLPVITSRFNGAGELITPGVEGSLVQDPADAEELAEQIRALLDAGTRWHYSQAARQLALGHTLERNCDEIVALYQEVRQRRGKA